MLVAALVLTLTAVEAPVLNGLERQGWDVARLSDVGQLTLTRVALGDQIPGFPQVWFRTEQLGRPAASSDLRLVEFDCAAKRTRLLEQFSYSAANLGGRKRQLFLGRAAWRRVEVVAEPTFARTCADPQAR